MTTQNENFGIMDEAYFVSRTEILSWVNDLLKVPSFLFRSTSPKSRNSDQAQSTARSWTLFIQEKYQWQR